MEKSFEYNGVQIIYNIYGSGSAILLIHGFGEDSRIFEHQVTSLQNNYLVIVPDLPGSGKSGLLESNDEISIDDYADCLEALLDQEKISSCIVLGHSMGGYITLAFAEKYAAMLQGFGLIHSSAVADTNEKKESRQQGIEMIKQYGAFAFLKNTTPNLFAEAFKKSNPTIVEKFIDQNKDFTSEALVQYYTAMMNRRDRTLVLQNTSVPVLFVLGKEDAAAPLDVVIRQVSLPSIAHIHILDNVGHMSMLEATDQLNDFLQAFAAQAIGHKE